MTFIYSKNFSSTTKKDFRNLEHPLMMIFLKLGLFRIQQPMLFPLRIIVKV